MKSFVLRRLKKTSAIRRTLAMFMVIALSFTMLSVDALAAKKVAKKAATKINVSSKKLYVGQTLTLKLTNGKKTIKATKATTSAKNNAAVSFNKKNGTAKVTAKKARKAAVVITLYNKKKAYKCRVTVINTKINKSAVTITEGKTYQLKLTGTAIKSVKTSNKKIATVNSKGLVKGVKAGSATVTLTGKNNVKHNCKVTVKTKIVKITGVKLSTTTPKIGETINATLEPKGANNAKSYQWYRTNSTQELMIKGETKASYTVSVGDVNTSLYCVVTDKSNKKFYSKETSKVQTAEIKKVELTGMSGKSNEVLKKSDIPVIGDTLKAVLDPESAANLVTYEWYRDSSVISEATSATYTVTADDAGSKIKCKIKAKDSSAVTIKSDSAVTTQNAMYDVSKLDISFNKTNPKKGDTLKVTAKNGDKTLSATELDYEWYRDEVKDANVIAGQTTASYEVDDPDCGHKLFCVVKGDIDEDYYGKFTVSTGTIIKELGSVNVYMEDDAASANALNGDMTYATSPEYKKFAVGKTIIAKFGDADTTAKYVWEVDGKTVAETSNKYTIKASDIGLTSGDNVTNISFKVTATGTGDYSGEKTVSFKLTQIDAKATIAGIRVYRNNEETPLAMDGTGNVNVGDVLRVEATPAAATGKLTYTWRLSNSASSASLDNANDRIFTGSTYTVTADDFGTGYGQGKIYVQAKYTGDDQDSWADDDDYYFGTRKDDSVSTKYDTNSDNEAGFQLFNVKKALTGLTYTTDNNVEGNKLASNYKELGVEVGAYIHAKVTPSLGSGVSYQWYRDKVVVGTTEASNGITAGTNGAGNTANYKICKADLGHKLICVATGSGDYSGSKVSVTTTEAVKVSSDEIKSVEVVATTPSPSITNYTAVTKMDADKTYETVITYKDGRKDFGNNENGYKIIWDASGRSSVSEANTFTAHSGDGIVSVTVKPDGVNVSGNAVNFTFKTAIGGESTSTTASISFASEKSNGDAINVISDTSNVGNYIASTAAAKLKATANGLPDGVAVQSYQWYGADSATATPEAIGGTTGDKRQLTITDYVAGGAAANQVYYVVVTGSNGKEYKSTKVTIKAPAPTLYDDAATFEESVNADSVTFANNGAFTTGADTNINVFDQFGQALSSGSLTNATNLNVYTAYTDETTNTAHATSKATITINSGKLKLTQSTDGSLTANTYYVVWNGIKFTVTISG